MKSLLILFALCSSLFASCATRPGGQTQSMKLDSGFLATTGTNKTTSIQGGTIADGGLFNGTVPLQAVTGLSDGAEVLFVFNFGADKAPDAPALTEDAKTFKNGLSNLAAQFGKNPELAAAAAAVESVVDALKPPPALPLGDRTGGQGLIRFRGDSEDARLFGVATVDNFASIRGGAIHGDRANASETVKRSFVEENTDAFTGQVVSGLVAYAQIQALDEAEEGLSGDGTPEKPTDPAVVDEPPADAEGRPGDNNFLWKPVSDNGKKLVVLLPAALGKAEKVTANGRSLAFSAMGNGNRAHYRGDAQGAAYGSPANVVATFPGGRTESWVVPTAGKRTQFAYKGAGSPPVEPVVEPAEGALFETTPNGITLRADFAKVSWYVDALTAINDPNHAGSTGPSSSVAVIAGRKGNTWTIPEPLAGYPTGNVPNTWRIRLRGTPPAGVTYHTSISQAFVRVGDNPLGPGNKTYPPTTRP